MQLVLGAFLHYAQAIDYIMLPALTDISSQQSQPTQENMKKLNQLIYYGDTYPNIYI